MNEQELDTLLQRSAPRPTDDAVRMARTMATQTKGARRSRRPRRRMVLVAAGGVALLATGAGTITAYDLSIPPFVAKDADTVRIRPGIPVDYTNSLGRRVECLAFMDFKHLSASQQAELERIPSEPTWAGYGDRVLSRLDLPEPTTPEAQNQAIFEQVAEDLWQRAHQAVPDLAHMGDSDGPLFEASTLSCAGPGGVDGRE